MSQEKQHVEFSDRLDQLEWIREFVDEIGHGGINMPENQETPTIESIAARLTALEEYAKVLEKTLETVMPEKKDIAVNQKRSWKSSMVQCAVWQRNLGKGRKDARAACYRRLQERKLPLDSEKIDYINIVIDRIFQGIDQTEDTMTAEV